LAKVARATLEVRFSLLGEAFDDDRVDGARGGRRFLGVGRTNDRNR
jgi:hypothetical protein